jgi:hypothetical protein
MAITYVASGAVNWVAAGGDNTPAVPTGVAAGDFLASTFMKYSIGTVTVPSGYTILDSRDSNRRGYANKMAVGGDTSPTWTFSDHTANQDDAACMFAFRGTKTINTNADLDSFANLSSVNLSIANGFAFPALTVNTDNCAIILIGIATYPFTVAAPDGTWATMFTDKNPVGGGPWNGSCMAGFYKIQTTKANITASTMVISAGAGTGQTGYAFIAAIPVVPVVYPIPPGAKQTFVNQIYQQF